MDDNKEKIRGFLSRFLRDHNIGDDEDIFAGFFNSLFAMQLVLFIESEFAVQVENDDLDMENFRTITAIAEMIKRKHALQEGAWL
jgi:methoxymalonate biosynthesis acyl carrier protein